MENSTIVTGTSPNYMGHLNQSYVSYAKSPEGIMYHDPVTTWPPLTTAVDVVGFRYSFDGEYWRIVCRLVCAIAEPILTGCNRLKSRFSDVLACLVLMMVEAKACLLGVNVETPICGIWHMHHICSGHLSNPGIFGRTVSQQKYTH